MKCLKYLVVAIFLNSSFSFAQDEETEYVPFLKTADFLVSANFGYPDWGKFTLNQYFSDRDVSETDAYGLAPVSIGATYFFNNQVSFSLTGFYNFWGGSWKDNFLNTDYSFNIHRVRIMLGAEYHFFDLEVNKTDFYVGGAFGGNSIFVEYASSDEAWTPRSENYFTSERDILDFPLSGRAYAGIRHFFNSHWGANIEASYGGPSLSFGINYKFTK